MALRLFSKSSKTTDTSATSDPVGQPLPGDDASPTEVAAAVRAATGARDRATLIARLDDAALLQSLAGEPDCLVLCADRLADCADVPTALALATTADARIALAIGSHNSELRNAQITTFASEAELIELEHASRSKNKACNRAARERLDALKKARTSADLASAAATELASGAQRLDDDAHLLVRYEALAQKHQAATTSHAAATAILQSFGEVPPALAPMPAAPETATRTPAEEGPDFSALSAQFVALQGELEKGTSAQALSERMAQAGQAWRTAIAEATPDAGAISTVAQCTRLYEQLLSCEVQTNERRAEMDALLSVDLPLEPEAISALPRDKLKAALKDCELADAQAKAIKKLTNGINYPPDHAAPDIFTALAARAHRVAAYSSACRAKQAEIETAFKDQVTRLGRALDDGELKKAEAARGEARALQDILPGGVAQATRKKFGALIANMQNLRDWQHFATDPKREELCTAMLKLADNPHEPGDQAEHVKVLRAQWNALGGKGPKDVAERFDAAAARAFEPCRLHYAELGEQRKANLQTRRAILEQLKGFVANTNWADTDLGAARSILNSAREEWRSAFPVERGPNRTLEKDFKAVTDTLFENLQQGWTANLAAKEELVTTAEALLTSEDPLPQRLDAAKNLQQRWKNAGPVPRGPDQKLWKRFRAACDELFNTRDAERDAAQALQTAQQSVAQTRLDQFAELLRSTDVADLEKSQLSAVKNDLNELEHLDRGTLKKARDLEDEFHARLKQKAAAKKLATLTELQALDEKTTAAELAGVAIPPEVLEANNLFANRATGEAHAHLDLVLEAETQCGIESPATDAQRRLELQVKWLNEGMNSGARKSLDGKELVERWCALQGTTDSDGLRERLFAAATQLLR